MERFRNICTCGGYASSMNGRKASNCHMDYCPQKAEYIQAHKEGKFRPICNHCLPDERCGRCNWRGLDDQ